jgi:hypothetical protein
MHKISEFFFEYILFPTAAVAYVVMIWGLIVWGVGAINQMRREQKDAAKKPESDAQNNGGSAK